MIINVRVYTDEKDNVESRYQQIADDLVIAWLARTGVCCLISRNLHSDIIIIMNA